MLFNQHRIDIDIGAQEAKNIKGKESSYSNSEASSKRQCLY
jgi:hypothetical protein